MDIEEIKKVLALLGLLSLVGCGSGDFVSNGGDGIVAVRVKSETVFNPRISHGEVETYRVTVEGEGVDVPIVAEFPGDADEGIIEGVPTGSGRTVTVSAINPNGLIIRAGEKGDVEVGGGVTDVDLELESVPIFTNITNGSVIDNTRLVFRIFADPASRIVVEDSLGSSEQLLLDAAAGIPEVELDEVTGLGAFSPLPPAAGEHRFVVLDEATGRSSFVDVRLTDGRRRTPAPFVAAGLVSDAMVSDVVSIKESFVY